MARQTHVDARGNARMVDVGEKPVTRRVAAARGEVRLSREAYAALARGALAKGDALAVARIAAIQAAKRTSEIVPLCHPVPLDGISVEIALDAKRRSAAISVRATTEARTGVEMEALTAVAAAALAIYDMVKGIDRSCRIAEIALVEKSGGRSGTWSAAGRSPRRKR
ncbi:MAG TPA: cyclic pyranopterin monophosphate synthase MoaC [Thermoanaerobaculia bacterium]|nr:cyclic pyranopterin monophosphate synthase MoaC [Thermoanaerobaculia bacterium]